MKEKLLKNKELIIVIVLILLLLVGGSFALFSLQLFGTKENVLKSGDLELTLDDSMSSGILLSNAYPIKDDEGLKTTEYTFTLENTGTIASDYTVYLDDLAIATGKSRIADKYIKYSLTKNGGEATTAILTTTGENPNRILDLGTIKGKTTNTYTLRVWIDYDADNEAMGKTFSTQVRVEAIQRTSNFIKAYTYNSSSCVTGEEDTCVATTCYENFASGSCAAGTIIKYKVNDTEAKYFHVLHDDGDTITMQQRENTVYNTAWYAGSDVNTSGPTTILSALETATNGWSNVNNQTYTMGTTNFNGTNAYTGCPNPNSGSAVTCTTNTYTLGLRTGKARMITVQEATSSGCLFRTNQSCPNWMNNYLYQSTSNGGTVDDNTQRNDASGTARNNYGYWTMSANSSISTSAWIVDGKGFLANYHTNNGVSYTYYGARAVVVVNK